VPSRALDETLPKLVGLTKSRAEVRLSNAGLQWHLIEASSPSAAAAGTVLAQTPAFPGRVRRGEVITLTVGKPYPTAAVPNVSNPPESAQAAQAALAKAGFTPKTNFVKATTTSELALEGKVLSQSPAAGSVKAAHSIVVVDVVSGAATVTIPATIVGETPSQAGATLAGAQLHLGTTTNQFSPTVPAGDVARTYPSAPGQSVTVSSTVNLVISTGPAAVVPDLEGDNIAEARHALRAAGLVLGHVNPAAGPNGLIVAQAAKPGRRLVQGIPITVVVGVSPVGNSGT
jgi:serine/threonine-protein kinase